MPNHAGEQVVETAQIGANAHTHIAHLKGAHDGSDLLSRLLAQNTVRTHHHHRREGARVARAARVAETVLKNGVGDRLADRLQHGSNHRCFPQVSRRHARGNSNHSIRCYPNVNTRQLQIADVAEESEQGDEGMSTVRFTERQRRTVNHEPTVVESRLGTAQLLEELPISALRDKVLDVLRNDDGRSRRGCHERIPVSLLTTQC